MLSELGICYLRRPYVAFSKGGEAVRQAYTLQVHFATTKCGYPSVPENTLRVFIGAQDLIKL